MYYTISREFIGISGIMYCTVFLRPYTAKQEGEQTEVRVITW